MSESPGRGQGSDNNDWQNGLISDRSGVLIDALRCLSPLYGQDDLYRALCGIVHHADFYALYPIIISYMNVPPSDWPLVRGLRTSATARHALGFLLSALYFLLPNNLWLLLDTVQSHQTWPMAAQQVVQTVLKHFCHGRSPSHPPLPSLVVNHSRLQVPVYIHGGVPRLNRDFKSPGRIDVPAASVLVSSNSESGYIASQYPQATLTTPSHAESAGRKPAKIQCRYCNWTCKLSGHYKNHLTTVHWDLTRTMDPREILQIVREDGESSDTALTPSPNGAQQSAIPLNQPFPLDSETGVSFGAIPADQQIKNSYSPKCRRFANQNPSTFPQSGPSHPGLPQRDIFMALPASALHLQQIPETENALDHTSGVFSVSTNTNSDPDADWDKDFLDGARAEGLMHFTPLAPPPAFSQDPPSVKPEYSAFDVAGTPLPHSRKHPRSRDSSQAPPSKRR